MSKFYLISGELIPELTYAPRACQVRRRLRNAVRDDLALVEVQPPIPKQVHGTDEDLSEVMLASRVQGGSLFPVTEWPMYVYVCRLRYEGQAVPEDVDDNFVILDLGFVYPTMEEAMAGLRLRLADRWTGKLL